MGKTLVSISLLLYEGVNENVFIHLNFQSFLILIYLYIFNTDFFLNFSGNNIYPFLLDENSLHFFTWFLLHYLLYLFSSNCLADLTSLTSLWSYKCVIWIYKFEKNTHRRVFRNLTLSNLENVLKWNQRTSRSKEYIYGVSGGKFFLFFSAWHQMVVLSWVQCFGLPQTILGFITPYPLVYLFCSAILQFMPQIFKESIRANPEKFYKV